MKSPEQESKEKLPPRGRAEKIIHKLAKAFNALHWGAGITTLPATATAREERSFVFMWFGIIIFMIVFFVGFFYFLTSF